MKDDKNSKERLPILNLMVLEILKKHSSEEQQLRQTDILRLLKEDYDMICDRRHVPDRLQQLLQFGFDIVEVKHGNSYCTYYMGANGLKASQETAKPKKKKAEKPAVKEEAPKAETQEKASGKKKKAKKEDKHDKKKKSGKKDKKKKGDK